MNATQSKLNTSVSFTLDFGQNSMLGFHYKSLKNPCLTTTGERSRSANHNPRRTKSRKRHILGRTPQSRRSCQQRHYHRTHIPNRYLRPSVLLRHHRHLKRRDDYSPEPHFQPLLHPFQRRPRANRKSHHARPNAILPHIWHGRNMLRCAEKQGESGGYGTVQNRYVFEHVDRP